MTLSALFNKAAELAEAYDGSEPAYDRFMEAAIAYEGAGGNKEKVDELLDMAIRAIGNVNREEDFLDRLARGGAQIFHHGAVFVRPDEEDGAGLKNGEGDYTPPVNEPRLREVVMALQSEGIFFDDLVVDVGRVSNGQMRKWPYVIVTIPRLNAQIAVADQKGEALFAANPAIPFMNWALFEKKMAGEKSTPFENVTRIVHAGKWEDRLMEILFGEDPSTGPKVYLHAYIKAHRKSKYPLTEEMVVAMARLYRERDAERQWPSINSGAIDRQIVEAVTGDPHWQKETWKKINSAGHDKNRNLTRSLRQILDAHGCHYNLSEEIVVAMARLYRGSDPKKRWPSSNSGLIDSRIVKAVTGDPNWQDETWRAIQDAGHQKNRNLTRSLRQILDAHGCHYNLSEEIVVAMARLYRRADPKKQWPTSYSGPIDPQVVRAVTGDPDWQDETWDGINSGGPQKNRNLTRSLRQILDAHGCHYNLSEEMVVAMARLYREVDPKKQWPTVRSGLIDPQILKAVTGDPDWQDETWGGINSVGRMKCRNLTRSLPQILDAHGCHYNLSEEMVVAMARLYREQDPKKEWPAKSSGVIDPQILEAVTGDPHWREENWKTINSAGRHKSRNLTRTMSQILDAHCPERGVVQGPVLPLRELAPLP
jgi:hypothetical protein